MGTSERASICRVTGEELVTCWEMGGFVLSDYVASSVPDPPSFSMTLCRNARVSEGATFVQLRDAVDPDLMYRRYYYTSGLNEAMVVHLGELAQAISDVVSPKVAVDIGANDGTLLSKYPRGVTRIGFDPSDIEVIPGSHEVRVNDYFSAKAYDDAVGSKLKADVVTTIAMFYDVADPIGMVREIDSILDDDGVWVCEMHYMRRMLESNGFDAICHEHLFYYDLTAFEEILKLSGTGMRVVAVDFNDVNGGSFCVYVRTGRTSWPVSEGDLVEATRKFESTGVPLTRRLEGFRRRCEDNRQVVRNFLSTLKEEGRLVLGYGASTKGSTMAQYWGLNSDLLSAIADRNEAKIGRVTSGTRIPIISEEEMRDMRPDYLLVFPYHFMDGFMKREAALLEQGTKFIVPMPYLTLKGASKPVHVSGL